MVFIPLGNALKQKMDHNNPLKKQLESTQLVEIATKVLGEILSKELSSSAKPLFLKNRTLTVSCGNSAVAQEIRLYQTQIVEKINQELGKNEVDRIRYLA